MGITLSNIQTGLLNQSSAQVIDGSLNFEGARNQALIRTPTTAGNRKIWTWSCWLKKQNDNRSVFFSAGTTSSDTGFSEIAIGAQKRLRFSGWNTNWKSSSERLRDYNNFYHFVIAVDYTNSTASNKVRLYKNGVEVTDLNANNTPSDADRAINDNVIHYIGGIDGGGGENLTFTDYQMSQVYFIDGLQLGPENFGFTDPLTGTWRPKKYIPIVTAPNTPSTVWSSMCSGTEYSSTYSYAKAFDDSTSTVSFASNGNTITFTPRGGITNSGNIVVTFDNGSVTDGGGSADFQINGSSVKSFFQTAITAAGGGSGSSRVATITGITNITSMSWSRVADNDLFGVRKIVVDGVTLVDAQGWGINGFYLPMDGNSPIGEDKSGIVTPNNGSIWSNSLTSSSGFRSSEPKTNAFDGNTSSICSAVGSGTITFTSPVTFASNSTIRVFLHGGDHTVTVNGGSNQTISAGSFQTVTYSNSGNANFVMTFHRGGGADTGVRAIEINGVILTDNVKGNSWTPVNFGGSNSVDKATGALPILNTTQGGTQATVGVRTDANSSNLFLALPLVGSTNDESNKINSGSTTKIATNSSVTASTTQSNFYGGSHHWNSNTDSLLYAQQGNDLVFGTGDFTIEFWFYDDNGHNGNNNRCVLFDNRRGGNIQGDPPQLVGYVDSHNEINLYYANGSEINITVPSTVGKWWHYAAVRSSGTTKLYIDGVEVGSASDTTNYPNNGIALGSGTDSGYSWSGYIQDFRVYKTAKYTSNFIPASTNPDILPDTPSGVSGGSKLTKITDGAVHFDGNGDYLEVKSATDFAFGTGDFTLEAYIYATSLPNTNNRIFCSGAGGAGDRTNFQLMVGSAGYLEFAHTTNYQTANGLIGPNKWYHVAATREGTSLKMFIDGVLQHTGTSSVNVTENGGVTIGREFGYTSYFNGFISNARILKGTALYTSNFTPPTRTLTNVTNTKLLCCQSPTNVRLSPVAPNVGITTTTRFNSNFESIPTTVNGLTVTNNGSVSTTSAGTNSYGFTNCADLSGSNSLSVNLGAIPQVSTYDIIFKVTGTTDNKYLFAISNTGLVRRTGSSLAWYNNNNDQTISTTPDDGEWHHLRVTPKSLYFDGVETQTTSTNPNIVVTSNGYMALGAYRNDSGTIQYNGAVDIGYVRVMPGVDLGAPSSIPITTNGTLSSTETIPNDGVIFAAANSAATNFNPFNTSINTVRGQETGYPTMNPLAKNSAITLEDGNLRITQTDSHGQKKIVYSNAKIPNGGKWYVEWIMGGGGACTLGIGKNGKVNFSGTDTQIGTDTNSWGYEPQGNLFHNGNQGGSFGSCAAGDVIGMTIDTSGPTLTIQWHKNGVLIRNSSGTICQFTGISLDEDYIVMMSHHTPNYDTLVNFGQKPFKFPPPDGFQPINATNIRPETVIARPDQYFNTTLWSGDDADPRQIDLGMAPDLIWVKTRNQTNWPWLSDSVRGTADKRYKLYSNSDTAQDTAPIYGQADSFNDSGFVAGGGTDGGGGHLSDSNKSGTNYVVWSWKAGGGKGTFNVDDEGYANASDVNMSVGALNNVAFNQSQNWSGNATGGQNVDRAFDGTGPRKDHYSHSSSSLTVNFSPALSGRIIVYGGVGGSGFDTYTLSDGSSQDSYQYYGSAPYYEALDFGVKSNITSLTCSNGYTLYGIRVDGKLLVDSGVSINAPSIAPTGCSVGTRQGFSIIKYQANSTAGATVPHGLSQAPNFVLVKSLQTAGSSNSDWTVFHSSMGGPKAMYLNEQDGSGATGSWRDKDPDANLITLGTAHVSNLSPNHYIAYAWHDVPGLQKFGSYGGADAFVELGFRPAVLIIKSESNSRNWIIIDSTRDTFNPSDRALLVNDNAQEDDNSVYSIDFLSNGFKIRGSNGQIDGDSSYIYAAWAAAPSVNLFGGQSNAR